MPPLSSWKHTLRFAAGGAARTSLRHRAEKDYGSIRLRSIVRSDRRSSRDRQVAGGPRKSSSAGGFFHGGHGPLRNVSSFPWTCCSGTYSIMRRIGDHDRRGVRADVPRHALRSHRQIVQTRASQGRRRTAFSGPRSFQRLAQLDASSSGTFDCTRSSTFGIGQPRAPTDVANRGSRGAASRTCRSARRCLCRTSART